MPMAVKIHNNFEKLEIRCLKEIKMYNQTYFYNNRQRIAMPFSDGKFYLG